jgi:hypothetical protein
VVRGTVKNPVGPIWVRSNTMTPGVPLTVQAVNGQLACAAARWKVAQLSQFCSGQRWFPPP